MWTQIWWTWSKIHLDLMLTNKIIIKSAAVSAFFGDHASRGNSLKWQCVFDSHNTQHTHKHTGQNEAKMEKPWRCYKEKAECWHKHDEMRKACCKHERVGARRRRRRRLWQPLHSCGGTWARSAPLVSHSKLSLKTQVWIKNHSTNPESVS